MERIDRMDPTINKWRSTPSSAYAGTTVKYGVSINGASGSVLYATGDIG